jgi:formylglycine-generating enzyme required for sulfatase activity
MYNRSKFTSDLINSYAWDRAIIFIQKCTTQTNYANQTSLNTGSLAQIGTTADKQCNIFDMASNVYELTTETSTFSNSPCVSRGSAYTNSNVYTISHRYDNISNSYDYIGFRPIIYLTI